MRSSTEVYKTIVILKIELKIILCALSYPLSASFLLPDIPALLASPILFTASLLHRAWLKRRHPPFSQRLVPVFWGKQLAPFLPFLSDWYRFYLPVHRNNTEVQHYPEPSTV